MSISVLISLDLIWVRPGGTLRIMINVIVLPIGGHPPLPSHGQVAGDTGLNGTLIKETTLLIESIRLTSFHLDSRDRIAGTLPSSRSSIMINIVGSPVLVKLTSPARGQGA